MFMMATGTQMVHVPYKGGLAAVADLNPGQIDVMFATTQTLLPQVKSGRARALGVTSSVRSPAAPDIPTVAEAGVPGFESSAWLALVTPKGTPREVITRVNGTVAKIIQMPDIVEKFNALGAETQNLQPAQVGAFIREEIVKWAKVVQAAGVTLE
jgi:tripartite-type tricarboxylate transporter receptor subunit TctC